MNTVIYLIKHSESLKDINNDNIQVQNEKIC